ncbi:hypothetical protein X979_5297 [Burkholderia pseudomallei MSHR7527]|nr:hypothetical protein X979_5297 [Burkholderia pseudomallei MSHR7527]
MPLQRGQSTWWPTPATLRPLSVNVGAPSSTLPPCVVVSPTQMIARLATGPSHGNLRANLPSSAPGGRLLRLCSHDTCQFCQLCGISRRRVFLIVGRQ